MKVYFVSLARLGQGNVHVKVEHLDSIVRYLEVSGKCSLGPACPDLVNVSNEKFEVEH
jgi:hypothetical protein